MRGSTLWAPACPCPRRLLRSAQCSEPARAPRLARPRRAAARRALLRECSTPQPWDPSPCPSTWLCRHQTGAGWQVRLRRAGPACPNRKVCLPTSARRVGSNLWRWGGCVRCLATLLRCRQSAVFTRHPLSTRHAPSHPCPQRCEVRTLCFLQGAAPCTCPSTYLAVLHIMHASAPHTSLPAVVGDTQAVFVADQAAGFAWRQLPFDLAGSRDLVEQGIDAGEHGSGAAGPAGTVALLLHAPLPPSSTTPPARHRQPPLAAPCRTSSPCDCAAPPRPIGSCRVAVRGVEREQQPAGREQRRAARRVCVRACLRPAGHAGGGARQAVPEVGWAVPIGCSMAEAGAGSARVHGSPKHTVPF